MPIKKKQKLNGLNLRPLAPLPERKSLGQHVFEDLKRAIIQGEIRPGNRLVESRIAESLNISRTPVREAIHKLEREGLIDRLPRGGFSVPGLTREDIEETFGIRSVLESYAARLAAEKHQAEDLVPLEMKIAEFQQCLDSRQMDKLPEINTAFHHLLYGLSRSPKLIRMINDLRDQIARFRKIILRVDNMAQASNMDHMKMLKAIKARDTDKVERLVKEHILRGQKALLRKLENSPDEF